MAEAGFGTVQVLLAASDPRGMAKATVGALQAVPPASLQGDTIVFVGTRETFGLVEPAAARSGATLRFVDATTPYPGKAEPEEVPGWFDGARD